MLSIDLRDLFDFTGTLFLLRVHAVWMLAALGLGAWVGWRTAGEGTDVAPVAAEDAVGDRDGGDTP